MKYYEHAAWDDAIRHACKRAARESGAGIGVYLSADGKMSVKLCTEAAADDQLCAIAQQWDKHTVQVRESGAHSTFVKV